MRLQGLVKENLFEQVRAVLDRRNHMRYGLRYFGFTPDDKLCGQYQALHPVMAAAALAVW